MKIQMHDVRFALFFAFLCAAMPLVAQQTPQGRRKAPPPPAISFSEDDFSSARSRSAAPPAPTAPSLPQQAEVQAGGFPPGVGCSDSRFPHRVAKVKSGDTLLLSDGSEVQLLGVDAPELVDRQGRPICFGREAAVFARDAVEGKCVRVETPSGVPGKNESGRALGYVFFPGSGGGEESLNELLVSGGYATAYPDVAHPERMRYIELQAKARVGRSGQWDACYEWVSDTSLGKMDEGEGIRRWTRDGAPDILIHVRPLASGTYRDIPPHYRQYDDGTVVELVPGGTDRVLLRRVVEGDVGEGLRLTEVKRAITANPDIQVRDFVKQGSRSSAFARAYSWQNKIGVHRSDLGRGR